MAQTPQQNFDAMRQDAIRRSREMQRRAVPMPPPSPPEQPLKPPVPRPEQPPLSEELHHLLTGWDSEKLTLLALLYLLYKEGAEPELLLALAYILL